MAKPRISQESSERLFLEIERLKTERSPLLTYYQEIASLVAPSLNDWSDTGPSTLKPTDTRDLYDNTGFKASLLLTDGIQGYSFSRRDPWFRNEIGDDKIMEQEEPAEYLQGLERHMYRQFNRSNFYDEGRLFTKMVGDFATGVMVARQDVARGTPWFETLHPKSFLLDQDDFGRAEVLFYEIWLRADQAIRRWGEESMPVVIKTAADQNSKTLFRFWHCIMPKDQYDLDISSRDARGKPWYSMVIADIERYTVVHDGGFDIKPFFAWRWARSLQGGAYGVDSPGWIELPNLKMTNGMTQDYARIVETLARPPIKATQGIAKTINLKPHGVTSLPAGEDFTAAMIAGNPAGVYEVIQQLRKGIEQSYHVDFFLILTQAIEAQKTATEVAGIQGEKAALMASFFSRMATEFLEPVHDYMVSTELASGRFTMPIPKTLQGMEVLPQMVSPLAMMQRRFLSLEPTKQALSEILAVAQFKPDILDGFDADQFRQIVAENYNMDRRVLIDLALVQKQREARAKMMEQQRQAELQASQAQTANQGSQAMKAQAEALGLVGQAQGSPAPSSGQAPAGVIR
jgi:hypothetical protein